jgi:drug/metabolite transporter (DMT)-like permease
MASAAEASAAQRTVGLSCALLGAVGFAFKSILVKAAYRYGVDAETFLALRMLYALPWLVLMGIAAARRDPLTLTRLDLLGLALLGLFGYYGSSYLDFLGLKYITAASLERVILFIYPWNSRLTPAAGGPPPAVSCVDSQFLLAHRVSPCRP